MKKRIISAVMALAMMVTVSAPLSAGAAELETAEPVVTLAETGTYGELEYEINEDGTVTITDCDESAVSIEVPNLIDDMYVTCIGRNAFYGCQYLSVISIPNTVHLIDDYAFA